MDTFERHRPLFRVRYLPHAGAVIAMIIGTLAVAGWVFNVPSLKSVLPDLAAMKMNTAFSIVLAGISLLGSQVGMRKYLPKTVAAACGGGVLSIGVLTLAEFLFGIDLGIDELLIRDITTLPGDIQGRMALNTAVCVTPLGAALLLLNLDMRRLDAVVQGLAVVPILGAGAAFIAYTYDLEALLRQNLDYTPMAINTAIALALLGIGVVSARPYFPGRKYLENDSAAGTIVRRILPATLVFIFVVGWLVSSGSRAGYFGAAIDVAIFSAVVTVGAALLILWNTSLIYNADMARMQVQQELRAALQYHRSLLEASLDPLVTISPDGKITDANEAAIQATGVPRDSMIGSDFSGYFTDPGKAEAGYREVFAKGGVRDYALSLRHRDGGLMDVLYNASLYRNGKGEVAGVFAAARDVTQRKRAEEELRSYHENLEALVRERTAALETANKDLEGFAYSVSHDLRVPLRAIDGFSHQVLTHYQDKLDDEGRRYLSIVRDNAQKMGKLIDDILAFSRMGRLGMSLTDIDMDKLAHEVLEELKPSFGERNIKVNIGPLPPVQADLSMLRQVWVNLLSNAIKFTRNTPAASIEVSGSAEATEAVYCVKDNGAGFDMQYAEKLFGVFQRLHGVEEFEGTGIGLAIVKRIVTPHGGRVWAEGKVDLGATFYFSLPMQERSKP